jgi:hypothetical protein
VFTTDVLVNQITFVERKGESNKPSNDNPFNKVTDDLQEELPF